MLKRYCLLSLFLVLGGCASTTVVDEKLATQLTPAQIIAGAGEPAKGEQLVWAGKIHAVHNLRDQTHIEILAYPVNRNRQPLVSMPSTGVFILEMQGFLEPADLPAGLPVTATGRYAGVVKVREGEVSRFVPILGGEHLQRWPEENVRSGMRPNVFWSIGIGSWGSGGGAGVSVGF